MRVGEKMLCYYERVHFLFVVSFCLLPHLCRCPWQDHSGPVRPSVYSLTPAVVPGRTTQDQFDHFVIIHLCSLIVSRFSLSSSPRTLPRCLCFWVRSLSAAGQSLLIANRLFFKILVLVWGLVVLIVIIRFLPSLISLPNLASTVTSFNSPSFSSVRSRIALTRLLSSTFLSSSVLLLLSGMFAIIK